MNGTVLGTIALVALIVWMVRRAARSHEPEDEPHDSEELEAAENEVRDLDTFASPDDEVMGDDWGPGASRRSPRD